jgi:hypothetical protein
VWPIITKNYTEFILENYKKLTSALEIAVLTSAKTEIILKRSRVIIVLLKCLQEFTNNNFSRHRALWYDKHRTSGRLQRGLGF